MTITMNNGTIETIIGRQCILTGVLTSNSNVRIDGVVEGEIAVTGEVTISATGRIRANIRATICKVGGAITGHIKARDAVIIEETAKAYCEIHVPSLTVARGATFKGSSLHDVGM